MTRSTPEPSLPEAFPWGVARVRIAGGTITYANAQLRRHYLDGTEGAETMDAQFGFPGGKSFGEVAGAIPEEGTWTGRVVPHHNRHGIASVEVTLHRDPADDGHVYLYTLEHPTVDGALRFSSRSEMQLLQVLLDNTLESVFFRDLEGRFILTNRAFRRAVGSDGPSVVTGRTIGEYVSPKSAAWVKEIDAAVERSGRPSVNRVSRFTFKNGTRHWLQMTTVPVVDGEGLMIGSVSVARDISDLKETESELRDAIRRAEEASRAKGEFLAAMSHEIRTPINGIVGAAELCQETRLDAEQRGYIDTVMQCSNTLLSLVNDVLDFSKIEAGQLNLERLSFSPAHLIEELSAEFARTAHKKGLELIVAYENDLPRHLVGDPTRIKQILYNLVGNAIKFTERGEVEIRAAVVSADESTAHMRFSVRDTGIGIADTRKEAIFHSFTQADMTTTRKYGGTGLGLTISRELALLMGGDIRVQSQIGEGSTFSLELPLERAVFAGADSIPYNPELAGLHVLIVDDNETNREIYRKVCAGWGYRSAAVAEGVEALRLLQGAVEEGDPFQLVILDQQMPGLNGLDVATLIRNRESIRETPMLLLSSSLNRSEMELAEKIGVARALSKPVRRSRLLEVILETFGVRGDAPDGPEEEEIEDFGPTEGSVDEAAPLQVLVVEDNPVNQRIATRRLEKLGHTVAVADNGRVAVESVRERRFDCVLMDIQMPDLDGYAATGEIRRMEQAGGLTPTFIVAMTAHAMKGDAEKCLNSGMDDYLAKPFRVERLRRILDRAQARRRGVKVAGMDLRPYGRAGLGFEERFLRMDEEDREDLVESVPILSESLPGDLERLDEALKAGDLERVGFMAHSLKGVAGIFGYQDVMRLAADLERICERGEADAARARVEDLVAKFRAMEDEIGRVLRRHRSECSAS